MSVFPGVLLILCFWPMPQAWAGALPARSRTYGRQAVEGLRSPAPGSVSGRGEVPGVCVWTHFPVQVSILTERVLV